MRHITQHAAARVTGAALAIVTVTALAGGCGRAVPTTATADAASNAAPAQASPASLDPAGAPSSPPHTAPTAAVTHPASAPPTTASTPDATTTLTAALDALATGYHFVTTATVGERVAAVAEGDHVAGATLMTVTSGGTRTEYLVTPDAAWVQVADGWQRLASPAGLTDPVAQLRSPRSVELAGTADAATITARYPAAALGLRSDGERTVEFEITDGLITSLRYAGTTVVTEADGTTSEQPSDVTAVITPIAPGTQITLPAADTGSATTPPESASDRLTSETEVSTRS